jgi:hypothetical protein
MADDNAAGGQQIFDHPQAERKSEVEPDRLAYDLGGKSVTAIKGFIEHRSYRLSSPRADGDVNVTVPLDDRGGDLRLHDVEKGGDLCASGPP